MRRLALLSLVLAAVSCRRFGHHAAGDAGAAVESPPSQVAMGDASEVPDAAPAMAAVDASIGLGQIGTIGGGRPQPVRQGDVTVNGRLPPEVIQRIVRQSFSKFRACYDAAKNPKLAGTVTTRFVIDREGNVPIATDQGSDLPDATVVKCVVGKFKDLSFPTPEGGIVTVVFPVIFNTP